MSSSQGNAQPWAWLGLLKWSLNYVDGTRDNSDIVPMSAEDRAFLEKVMKEGIIDENERMKVILQESAKAMEFYKTNNDDNNDDNSGDPPISTDDLEDLLQELRDIVEQIDYARAFCSMKGLPFLLGCVSEPVVPQSIRATCLGILSTLAQNNPHVQQELLESGACKTLSDLFFSEQASASIKAKVMQALSSIVRNNEVPEQVFCSLPQAPTLFMEGLRVDNKNKSSLYSSLQTKSLFFLKALLTSDASTPERVKTFQTAVVYVADHYLDTTTGMPPDLREMTISLLEQLVDRKLIAPAVLASRKDVLVAQAVQRISQIRALTGEEKEFAQMELDHWETFLVVLARG
jgi:hsp70-interacting protein